MTTQKNKILFLFADAARELKIDPKTIPNAIKAGRDSFTRKSDGKKFTFEIPEENTPSRKKPKPLSEEEKAKWAEAKRQRMIVQEFMTRAPEVAPGKSFEYMKQVVKNMRARDEKREREMNQPPAEK